MQPVKENDVCAVILAGTHRWGESCLDAVLPRALLPVANSPLLAYGVRWLRDAGVRRAVVCANSESRLVRRCLASAGPAGVQIDYYEDEVPRGPAGCIRDAALDCDGAREIVVVEAALIPQIDLPRLIAAHRQRSAQVSVVASHQPGMLPGEMAPAGVYVFSCAALRDVSPRGYQDIKETVIPRLHAAGATVVPYPAEGACLRVSDEQTYLAACAQQAQACAGGRLRLAGYRQAGSLCVHESARVAAEVRVAGPVLIGPRTQVSAGVTLLGPLTVGADCRIGAGAVLSRSAIWDKCRVGAQAWVDTSIVTSGVEVEARSEANRVLFLPAAARRARIGGGLRRAPAAHGRRASSASRAYRGAPVLGVRAPASRV